MTPERPEPPRYQCRHLALGGLPHGVVTTRAFGKPVLRLELRAQLCAACMRELLEQLELELERVDAAREH